MKPGIARAAAERLGRLRQPRAGPIADAQAALFAALMRGDMPEASRQASIVKALRGDVPPSPEAAKLIALIERRLAALRPAQAAP